MLVHDSYSTYIHASAQSDMIITRLEITRQIIDVVTLPFNKP